MKQRTQVVTIDLDMTIADHRRRLKRACSAKGIDRAILLAPSEISTDRVISGAKMALETIRANYSIVFLSSRSKQVRSATKKWLINNDLWHKSDRLLVVDSEAEKLSHIKRLLPRLYAVIDDFKYDYQSGKPKISDYLLPKVLALKAPVIIFDNNWRAVIRTYFMSDKVSTK